RAVAPRTVDRPRGGGRSGADRVHERKILGERGTASHLNFGGMLFRERSGRGLQFSRPHVVRRRVREVSAERHALDHVAQRIAVDAFRKNEAYVAPFRFAVSRKLVTAERKCQCRKPCIMRLVCETIGARRQKTDQLSRPKPVALRVFRVFDTKQHPRHLAVATWQQQRPARLCFEGSRADERLLGAAKLFAHFVKVGGTNEPDRNRLAFAGGRKNGMHDYSAASRIEGLSW